MALRSTKPNEDAPQPRGAKPSGLPPGFCPARSWHFRRSHLQGSVTGSFVTTEAFRLVSFSSGPPS